MMELRFDGEFSDEDRRAFEKMLMEFEGRGVALIRVPAGGKWDEYLIDCPRCEAEHGNEVAEGGSSRIFCRNCQFQFTIYTEVKVVVEGYEPDGSQHDGPSDDTIVNWMRGLIAIPDNERSWEIEALDGSILLTKLAEAAAEYFDRMYWLDDETHRVWDLAVRASEPMEK